VVPKGRKGGLPPSPAVPCPDFFREKFVQAKKSSIFAARFEELPQFVHN